MGNLRKRKELIGPFAFYAANDRAGSDASHRTS